MGLPKFRRKFLIVIFFCIKITFLSSCDKSNLSKFNPKNNETNTFSYNVPISPQSFDPLLQQGTNARYVLNHLYMTLYKWDQNGELKLYGAEKCMWQNGSEAKISNTLLCTLKKNLKFQDGSSIKAIHYIHSLNLMKNNPTKKTLDFRNIIFKPINDYNLEFKVLDGSKDLKHKLAAIEISPRKKPIFYKTSQSVVSSTKFYISEYSKNQTLLLKHISKNLWVKIYFIEDQSTALRLYKSGQLDLLTMLPVREIESYKNKRDLFHISMNRMDGLFFNAKISLAQKKIMFHALNFDDLKKLYHSIGQPGCPALARSLYLYDYCYTYRPLDKSKALSAQQILRKFKLSYSTLGGDDIQRGMEWMAYEWNKNLKLSVTVEPLESGVFFKKIQTKNFDIIRKGIPLDAPTCLEALSSFFSKDPNNLSDFKDSNFDKLLQQMRELSEDKLLEGVSLCDKALRILHQNYVYLPLGPMYFSFLQNGTFKGWSINSLNILDLENLEKNLESNKTLKSKSLNLEP